MGAFTTTAERIIRQPALTMPGNATGSEAACTALTGSQIRAICGLGTTDIPTFGGAILNGDLLFSPTNQKDIGNGTYDPRTVRAATSVLTPLVNNAAAALTLGNSTYGVTVPGAMGVGGANTGGKQLEVNGTGDIYLRSAYPTVQMFESGGTGGQAYLTYYLNKIRLGTFDGTGPWRESFIIEQSAPANSLVISSAGAATFSGDISMSKTSAQGYIYAYDTTGAKYIRMYQGSSSGHLVNTAGRLYLQGATSLSLTAVSGDIDIAPSSGNVYMAGSGGNGTFVVYDADASTSIRLANDGTDGKLSTTSGSIIYTPANGLAYQFTSGTDSQFRVYNAAGTKFLAIGIATANDYCSIQSGGTNMKLTLQEVDGRPLVVGNTGTAAAKFHVRADATAGSGLPVRIDGVTGNGSNLTEWGLYNSTTLAAITSTGGLTCAGITASGAIQETYRTSSLDPTTSDIGSGKRQGWYNTSSLEFRDWVNVGGTLYKSATYT